MCVCVLLLSTPCAGFLSVMAKSFGLSWLAIALLQMYYMGQGHINVQANEVINQKPVAIPDVSVFSTGMTEIH